jgi:ribosomal-protein-serine acetyltransferase
MMLSPRLDRLGIRPLEIEDADELHALVEGNREHLARWMPWAAAQDREGTERFLAEAEEQLIRTDGFQAAVEPDGEILGVVGFHSIDWTNRNTSLGYWLAADAQGAGTMTTVVSALLDYAFYEWELHRVEIHCAPENIRSRAIPERLGFREEARLREAELVGGRYLDSVVYGMLEAEWESRPT